MYTCNNYMYNRLLTLAVTVTVVFSKSVTVKFRVPELRLPLVEFQWYVML